MALNTVDEMRQYLRIEHTNDDVMLEGLLAEADALIETEVGRAIVTSGGGGARTFGATALTAGWRVPQSSRYGGVAGSVDYTASGTATTVGTASESPTPFDQHPDYAARLVYVLKTAERDHASDLYKRRNTAASYESSGGGVSVTYAPTSTGLSERLKALLAPLKAMSF